MWRVVCGILCIVSVVYWVVVMVVDFWWCEDVGIVTVHGYSNDGLPSIPVQPQFIQLNQLNNTYTGFPFVHYADSLSDTLYYPDSRSAVMT